MITFIVVLKNDFIITKPIFFLYRVRRLSRILMYTCALIDEVMTAIFPDPLKDMQYAVNRHQTKVSALFNGDC